MTTSKILLCFALVATTLTQAPLEDLKQNDAGYLSIKNAEFLFTGGIHVKNDKYWCLHQAVYRKPTNSQPSSAPQTASKGRILQQLQCDSGCFAMSDFLCSNSHLEFTDNPEVCMAMSTQLGQKWKPFFTNELFRIKMAHAINSHYKFMKNIKQEPRSNYRMRQPAFLQGCEKQIEKEMYDLLHYLGDLDIIYAHQNQMNDQVIEYVLLNVEDLFIKDKPTAADAWRNSYSDFKQKCAGKKFSEYSVRYFIEDIRLRYKPRTDIPTPNQEKLGIPLFGPEKELPPPKPEFPDLLESPLTKNIFFEFEETPRDYKNFPPYSKVGRTNNPPTDKPPNKKPPTDKPPTTNPPKTNPPLNPPPEDEGEMPGDILEQPNVTPPEETKSEPEEKPTVPPTPPGLSDSDKITRVEIIEIQRSWNIEKALVNYEVLTTSMKRDIRACGLSLAGAIQRCERVFGTGNCEAITPTYVGKKCPANYVREGCCTCVQACPPGFPADRVLCKKPKAYLTNPRSTEKDCYLANAVKCEKVSNIFAATCKQGFERVGSALCVAKCPNGTTDMGDACKRSLQTNYAIFAWTAGDE